MIPTLAANPTCEDKVIFPPPELGLFVIDWLVNCFDIIILELDVSIIDTFFFGNLENNPDSWTFAIKGTFILNVELVDIPAAKIVSSLTPVTPTPKGDNVNVVPSPDILLTRLYTGSAKVPWLYAIIASVFIPTFPVNLRFATVAVLVELPPNTERLSAIEKYGNTLS